MAAIFIVLVHSSNGDESSSYFINQDTHRMICYSTGQVTFETVQLKTKKCVLKICTWNYKTQSGSSR